MPLPGSPTTGSEHETFRTEPVDHVPVTNPPQETTPDIAALIASSKPFDEKDGDHTPTSSTIPSTANAKASVDSTRPTYGTSPRSTRRFTSDASPTRGQAGYWTTTEPTWKFGNSARDDSRMGALDGGMCGRLGGSLT